MAYADQEGSIQDGAPYFLYDLNTPSLTYRYTDYPSNIDWNGDTWNSFPIKHSEVKQSNELSKNSLTVTIPITGDFANLFKGWSPDYPITMTIRRGHFGASDTLVYWKGRISSHVLKDEVLELKCESIFTSMRRPGVRARYQRNCRHALYSVGCNVDKNAFSVTGVISSFDGITLSVSEASSQTDGWFIGGAIEFPDGSFRMITNHSGSILTVSRAVRFLYDNPAGYGNQYGELYGGLPVIMYPGCDRTITTCLNKFNNLDNQGGFKWIPSKNPFGGSSIA